jgi:putative oxidoreductase
MDFARPLLASRPWIDSWIKEEVMPTPLSEPARYDVGRGAGLSGVPHPATSLWRAFVDGDGHVAALERYGPLVARLLLSQIFILSGIMKVMDPAGTAAQMEGRGMVAVPFFLWSAAAVEILGALSLLLGFKARLGALLLFLFLIPVTLTFHNFWTYPPEQQQQQMILFMHNLTLMGGLVLVMTFGPGPLSLDRTGRRSA